MITFQGNSIKYKKLKTAFAALGLIAVAAQLFAREASAVSFSPSAVSGLTEQGMVDSLLKTVAIGADHRDFMPASPMGILLGFDVGVNFTAIKLPTEFTNALASVTGQTPPSYIPLPRVSLHKGLPFGVDLGFSYFSLTDPNFTIKMYGGSIQWAFLDGNLALPAMAVRLTGDYSSLGFISTHTYKADLVVSKNFYVVEPYFGLGLQKWSGDLNFSADLGSLPASVSASSSGTNTHYFGGLALKLLVLRITGEADYSSAGFVTYGLKAGFGF
jgi:hypothetical protein